MQAINPIGNDALLSTLTQSGAALVAIIAGLLVARLVTLVGERDTWRRRIGEMLELRKELEGQLEENRIDWLNYDGKRFVERIQSSMVWNPDMKFESLYDSHAQDWRSRDELRPYFEELKADILDLRSRVTSEISDGIIVDWFDGGKEKFVRSYPREKRDLVGNIAELVMAVNDAKSNRQARRMGIRLPDIGRFVSSDPVYAAARMQRNWQVRDGFREEDERLRSELRKLDLELSHANRALDSVSAPGGLRPAFLALGFVA